MNVTCRSIRCLGVAGPAVAVVVEAPQGYHPYQSLLRQQISQ